MVKINTKKLYSLTNLVRVVQSKLRNSKNHWGPKMGVSHWQSPLQQVGTTVLPVIHIKDHTHYTLIRSALSLIHTCPNHLNKLLTATHQQMPITMTICNQYTCMAGNYARLINTSNATTITKVRSASFRLVLHAHCSSIYVCMYRLVASTWRPLLSVITTLLLYYVAHIIHCRVWYRALSLRYACIWHSGTVLIQ